MYDIQDWLLILFFKDFSQRDHFIKLYHTVKALDENILNNM